MGKMWTEALSISLSYIDSLLSVVVRHPPQLRSEEAIISYSRYVYTYRRVKGGIVSIGGFISPSYSDLVPAGVVVCQRLGYAVRKLQPHLLACEGRKAAGEV